MLKKVNAALDASMPVVKYNTRKLITASVVAVVSIICSVIITLKLVTSEGMRSGREFVSTVASEVLHHGETVSDQLNFVFESLRKDFPSHPCSEQHILAMQSLAIRFSQIQMIGFIPQSQILCSSVGKHVWPVSLGDADSQWQSGAVYTAHEFPMLSAGVKLMVIEKSGYAVAVSPDTPIDVLVTQTDLSVGIYSQSARKLLTGRGEFSEHWIARLGKAEHLEFSDGHYIVALRRSSHHDFIAYAAVPVERQSERVIRIGYLFIPLCLIVSTILVAAFIFLTRRYLSPKASLHCALKKNELFVVYQPIVDLRTRRWVGAEALVRWRRSDGTLVGPDVFIPLAEEHRLIQQITKRVISLVFHDAPDLLRIAPDFYVSINLSSADLQSETFARELGKALLQAELPPSFLHVEATERGFVNTVIGRKVIRDIRAMGVTVAIDDFGTGYSSLSYLGTFELDYLKIDKSFIDVFLNELDEIDQASQMTLHIIDIAKSMQLEMIAEGVEREEQATELGHRGVEFAQGWLFGKPMSVGEILVSLVAFKAQALASATDNSAIE